MFFEAMDLHRTFNLNSSQVDSSNWRIISNERKIVQQLGLIRMSLVRRGLTKGIRMGVRVNLPP